MIALIQQTFKYHYFHNQSINFIQLSRENQLIEDLFTSFTTLNPHHYPIHWPNPPPLSSSDAAPTQPPHRYPNYFPTPKSHLDSHSPDCSGFDPSSPLPSTNSSLFRSSSSPFPLSIHSTEFASTPSLDPEQTASFSARPAFLWFLRFPIHPHFHSSLRSPPDSTANLMMNSPSTVRSAPRAASSRTSNPDSPRSPRADANETADCTASGDSPRDDGQTPIARAPRTAGNRRMRSSTVLY